MESLEKTISFFRHVYSVYLAENSKRNCTSIMASWSRTLLAISDCITFDLRALKSVLQVDSRLPLNGWFSTRFKSMRIVSSITQFLCG